jgi:PAS domain S-box-containing protein
MLKVLYVDDEPGLLELAKAFLESEGDMEVATCCSGHDVLNLLPSERFDALISDYQMPEMDGIELLRAIRHRYPALPFVLFTGKGREEVAMEAIRHGADSYIMKGGDARSQFKVLANEVKLAAARREAEEAVHYNLSRFNIIMRNLSEIILIATESGRITYVSPSVTSVLGYQREELEGKNLKDIWQKSHVEGSRPSTEKTIMDLMRPEGAYFTIPAKEGSVRRFHGKANLVEQGDGRIMIATFKDVTYLRGLEEQLTMKELLFSVILDQLPMACGISDLETGRLFHINAKVSELLGIDPEEILGKTSIEIGVWDPEQRADVLRSLSPGKLVRGIDVQFNDGRGGKQSFDLSGLRLDLTDGSYLFWTITPKGESPDRCLDATALA